MLLSDFTQTSFKRILICGPPGTRKTTFACSFPGKTKVLDFDGKIGSAAAWYAAKNPARLKEIEVESLSSSLDPNFDPMVKMTEIITKELIPQQAAGKLEFPNFVIDSGTTFSAAVLRHIIKTNPGIKRSMSAQGVQACQQDYGILKREFSRLIPGLLSLPMNFIMTAHIEVDKSELTGEIIRKPIMDGSFAQSLPIHFDEVYRTYIRDGKVFAQTQSDPYYDFCRSSIPGIPKEIELSYEALTKKYI